VRAVQGRSDYMAASFQRIVLLGCSGSIGKQAIDVVSHHADRTKIVGISVYRSVEYAVEQALRFEVQALAIGDISQKSHPALDRLPHGVEVLWGEESAEALIDRVACDTVLNALVGIAGLRASYRALASGKRLALANKESLVVGGDLLMPLSREGSGLLLPVDSEHSALFQCLVGEDRARVTRFWITASGGPFRGYTRQDLSSVTREKALAHPTWHMGSKISIDSSTLMNKGLEVIEAHHLFAASYDDIRIVVHPQSCVHSMVEYCDGSVKAHLGITDMRIPIQYALGWPDRWEMPLTPLDFTQLGALTFEAPDFETFGCLKLALEAGRAGGTAPAVLNAANEVAVAAFLGQRCEFLDIEGAVAAALDTHECAPVESLDQLESIDAWARAQAFAYLESKRR
jgi:1-deoxy-D-xylulose-5-phosphate reductoisomerase